MLPYSLLSPGLWLGWPSWSRLWTLFLTLWTIFWSGWALWNAARSEKKGWFIVILLTHTFGFLEIVYLFFISPSSFSNRDRVKRVFSR